MRYSRHEVTHPNMVHTTRGTSLNEVPITQSVISWRASGNLTRNGLSKRHNCLIISEMYMHDLIMGGELVLVSAEIRGGRSTEVSTHGG